MREGFVWARAAPPIPVLKLPGTQSDHGSSCYPMLFFMQGEGEEWYLESRLLLCLSYWPGLDRISDRDEIER